MSDRIRNAKPLAAPGVAPDIADAVAEIITVTSRSVACDGGGGPLGHPRVWLRIVHERTFCPYCSRIYVLAAGAGHDTH